MYLNEPTVTQFPSGPLFPPSLKPDSRAGNIVYFNTIFVKYVIYNDTQFPRKRIDSLTANDIEFDR
jgi:hypothetical protein